jgi:hypothetical protein
MESKLSILHSEVTTSLEKLCKAHLYAQDWQQESLTFVPLRGS